MLDGEAVKEEFDKIKQDVGVEMSELYCTFSPMKKKIEFTLFINSGRKYDILGLSSDAHLSARVDSEVSQEVSPIYAAEYIKFDLIVALRGNDFPSLRIVPKER